MLVIAMFIGALATLGFAFFVGELLFIFIALVWLAVPLVARVLPSLPGALPKVFRGNIAVGFPGLHGGRLGQPASDI